MIRSFISEERTSTWGIYKGKCWLSQRPWKKITKRKNHKNQRKDRQGLPRALFGLSARLLASMFQTLPRCLTAHRKNSTSNVWHPGTFFIRFSWPFSTQFSIIPPAVLLHGLSTTLSHPQFLDYALHVNWNNVCAQCLDFIHTNKIKSLHLKIDSWINRKSQKMKAPLLLEAGVKREAETEEPIKHP